MKWINTGDFQLSSILGTYHLHSHLSNIYSSDPVVDMSGFPLCTRMKGDGLSLSHLHRRIISTLSSSSFNHEILS